ncbi:MAG: M23 family metallopeptidase [Bacteroidota bacterium]
MLNSISRLLLLVLLAAAAFSCMNNETGVVKEVPKPNPFNLDEIDNLIEVRDTIKANETVSDILTPHGVTPQFIHKLEMKALKVFPLSQFRAEKELFIYAKWDSVETVKYMVYVIDEIDHLVFDFRDSINIYKSQRKHDVKQVEVRGKIKSGLIQDLQELGFHEDVGYNTADVFESRIDFMRLQEGDTFDIIFDQYYVEGKPVKVGKVYAAKMNHIKKNYYAFLYEKDKPNSYYDEKGESLVGMFLTAPLKFRYRISSRYSKSRLHPVLHRRKAHLGTDFAAPHGSPIQSTAHGIVTEVGYNSGNGNYVKIKHNSKYSTQYLHMSKFAKGIRRGIKVSQGQIIGYVGSTGLATGPHVCYRFWKNGKQVDPFREKGNATTPLNKKHLNDFKNVAAEYKQRLDISS